jgi:hypothetical protein
VTVLRIPGDVGIVPPVGPDGKPRGSDRTGKDNTRGSPDIIEFSSSGKRLGADFASESAGVAGRSGTFDTDARATVEQRMASGYYERKEVLEAIADIVLEQFGI